MELSHQTFRQGGSWTRGQFAVVSLAFCGLQIFPELFFKGIFVQCQVVRPDESSSTPSTVIGIKGSSVWLHWGYTYVGDGMRGGVIITTMVDQVIAFRSKSQSTTQTLARKVGQNGNFILQSPVPAPFDGRVGVISSNDTIVIHNLQYNDSAYEFVSSINVNVDSGSGNILNTFNLRPDISITMLGIPAFIVQPPNTLEINEGSNLTLRIEMDGNPQPSADFRWLHRTGSSPTNVPSDQLYPFVYSSTYILNNIDASYCGRILQTTIKNSIGSSSVRNTNVTVLSNLRQPLNVRAAKKRMNSCVEVKWNRLESGACSYMYHIKLKDRTGDDLYNTTVRNAGESTVCNLVEFSNITDVQLTVSFRTAQRSTRAIVTPDIAAPTTVSTTVPTTVTATVATTLNTSVNGTVNTTLSTTANSTANMTVFTTVATTVNNTMNSTVVTKTTNTTANETANTTASTIGHTTGNKTVATTVNVTVNTTANNTLLPPSKRPRTAEGTDLIFVIGVTFGGLMLLILVVVILIFFIEKVRRGRREYNSSNQGPSNINSKGRQQNVVELVGMNQMKKLQRTI